MKYEAPCLYWYDCSAAAVRVVADSVRFRREWGVAWARSRPTEFPYAPLRHPDESQDPEPNRTASRYPGS